MNKILDDYLEILIETKEIQNLILNSNKKLYSGMKNKEVKLKYIELVIKKAKSLVYLINFINYASKFN